MMEPHDPTQTVPPPWRPDNDATECLLCDEPFTLFRRRHHCRYCGEVFCDTCCAMRVSLPQLGYVDPVRVCGTCYLLVGDGGGTNTPDIEEQVVRKLQRPGNEQLASDAETKEWQLLITALQHQQQRQATVLQANGVRQKSPSRISSPRLNRKLFRTGIPSRLRGTIWPQLSESVQLQRTLTGVYSKLLEAVETQCQFDPQIKSDISRTFPSHAFFADPEGDGQRSLSNILRAWTVYRQDIGYCQGMSFIAAVILMHMDEESAFWMLAQLMAKYGLEGYFQDGGPLLAMCCEKFTRYLKEMLPHLDEHFQKQQVTIEIIASQWLRTLYAYSFPLPIVFRIWDVFLVEGLDFLIWVGLTVLETNQAHLLSLREIDILKFFRQLPEDSFTQLLHLLEEQSEDFAPVFVPSWISWGDALTASGRALFRGMSTFAQWSDFSRYTNTNSPQRVRRGRDEQ